MAIKVGKPSPESELAAFINLEQLWEAAYVIRSSGTLAASDRRYVVDDENTETVPSESLTAPQSFADEPDKITLDAIWAIPQASQLLPVFALTSPSPKDTYWNPAIGVVALLLILSLAEVMASHKRTAATRATSPRISAEASSMNSFSPHVVSPDLSAQAYNRAAKTSPSDLAVAKSKLTNGYVVREILPEYPEQAREKHVQGPVIIDALVGTDGTVRDLRVVSGNPLLEEAATAALRNWRFRPYLQNGKAAEFRTTITLNFTLR